MSVADVPIFVPTGILTGRFRPFVLRIVIKPDEAYGINCLRLIEFKHLLSNYEKGIFDFRSSRRIGRRGRTYGMGSSRGPRRLRTIYRARGGTHARAGDAVHLVSGRAVPRPDVRRRECGEGRGQYRSRAAGRDAAPPGVRSLSGVLRHPAGDRSSANSAPEVRASSSRPTVTW